MSAPKTFGCVVTRLRIEYENDAIGIGTPTPRVSWIADPGEQDWSQASYEIEMASRNSDEVISTGPIVSADSVFVAWPFSPLRSREQVQIRVRCGDAAGVHTDWSGWLAVEAGLLTPEDWIATPITADEQLDERPERPVRFRREFLVRPGLETARLYVSALGIYEAECNGDVVGGHVLAPGWTSYAHRLRYQTFDVTSFLVAGDNAIGITVSEGWYRGRIGFRGGKRSFYGDQVGPIAQLELRYDDGTETVVTDELWRAFPSPMLEAGIYDGERYDARLDEPGWSSAGFGDQGWSPVAVLPSIADRLIAPTGPPVRRVDLLPPISISEAPSGATLVDFGQNISGRLRLSVTGPAGTTITLRHAEVLEDGELGVRPLRDAAATDTFTLAGTGIETYEPIFTIHGFRFAEVTGWPGELTADDIAAVVLHSDMEPTGSFRCSHVDLEQLHDNVKWSMRGNFVDIPTDCPQRDERLGWTGDIQVFAPTASFLYDCNGFLSSWLEDLTVEQTEYGTVLHYVPWIPLLFSASPAAAWGDAAVIVPWVLWQRYGDLDLLDRQYDSMQTWVDQIASIAGDNYLWDTGFQFGDWLDPAAPPENPADARTDATLVATAYHAYTTRLLARMAELLGRKDDRARYEDHADRVIAAFNAEFVTPTGRMASDAQTAYALALEFDLLPSEQQRSHAAARLAELVAKSGFQIGTGFVGTPLICDALANNGYIDSAYHLLLQEKCPSWLYPVTMGATTVWERWDSMLPDGSINPGEMTSFNHYALGAVADFLHRAVAGLSPIDAGYRRFLVRPRPGGGLASAGATVRTPYGAASVDWVRAGDMLDVDILVPAGCSAVVELPGVDRTEIGPGRHRLSGTSRPAELDPERPPPRLPMNLDDDLQNSTKQEERL